MDYNWCTGYCAFSHVAVADMLPVCSVVDVCHLTVASCGLQLLSLASKSTTTGCTRTLTGPYTLNQETHIYFSTHTCMWYPIPPGPTLSMSVKRSPAQDAYIYSSAHTSMWKCTVLLLGGGDCLWNNCCLLSSDRTCSLVPDAGCHAVHVIRCYPVTACCSTACILGLIHKYAGPAASVIVLLEAWWSAFVMLVTL